MLLCCRRSLPPTRKPPRLMNSIFLSRAHQKHSSGFAAATFHMLIFCSSNIAFQHPKTIYFRLFCFLFSFFIYLFFAFSWNRIHLTYTFSLYFLIFYLLWYFLHSKQWSKIGYLFFFSLNTFTVYCCAADEENDKYFHLFESVPKQSAEKKRKQSHKHKLRNQSRFFPGLFFHDGWNRTHENIIIEAIWVFTWPSVDGNVGVDVGGGLTLKYENLIQNENYSKNKTWSY